ncbi:hypothetical protein R6Q59_029248, partial [Mikania micrantha]
MVSYVMNKLQQFLIFFFSVLPSIRSQKPVSCDRSCPGGQNQVPYPFGFSSGCQIQLNCTSNGAVLIGEFPVLEINYDSLLVSVPQKCNHPADVLSHLFGKHYAPTNESIILMNRCTEPPKDCLLGAGLVLNSKIPNCSIYRGDYISCYLGDTSRMFLDYEVISRMGCQLLSGLVARDPGSSSGEPFDYQVLKLGWWLIGTCDCSGDADCTKIVSPADGSDGYRCKCNSEFVGDGYKSSSYCRNIKGSKGANLKLIIGISFSITASLFVVFVILCRKSRLRSTPQGREAANDQIELFTRNYKSLAPKRYKYSKIKKITNSFQDKLGQGGYGSVYKGQLSDGHLVAVKLLSETTGDGEDFINEIESISRTSHVNIVTLLGFCIEGTKRALIYEFVPNGSLDKFLCCDDSHLNQNTLFQIAKGIARGLEYLHRGCNTRIVHFDIKPHNILLD